MSVSLFHYPFFLVKKNQERAVWWFVPLGNNMSCGKSLGFLLAIGDNFKWQEYLDFYNFRRLFQVLVQDLLVTTKSGCIARA